MRSIQHIGVQLDDLLNEKINVIGETCTVLEMAAGTWHAVLSLDTGGIIFEVKHGGYQPVAADDYAHWAPAEGEPGTTELMAWYAQAQVGDSTFAV
ncbi:TPA: WbuC family cupin fold metalloprotein [Enterobacter hormaechei subsp. hoffmannii]